MEEHTKQSPWLSASFHPRKTIREIIDQNPKRGFIWLASLYAFQYLLFTVGFSLTGTPWILFVISLLISPVLGILWFYVYGWFLTFTGRWLKGKATGEQLRSAFAWSKVPVMVNYPIWIILVISSGSIFFSYGPLLSVMNLIMLAISIWSLVLLIGMVAEVQGFSIGRSIANILLASLIFCLIPFLISLIWSAFIYVN